jgi:hypothetical protein
VSEWLMVHLREQRLVWMMATMRADLKAHSKGPWLDGLKGHESVYLKVTKWVQLKAR